MGVSPACVAAVVKASGDKFDDAEAAELIRSIETLKRAEEAAGNIDGLDARVRGLAAQEADRARIAAAKARRNAALAAVAYDRSLRQVRELVALGRRHDQALLAVFEGDGQRGLPNGRSSVQSTRNAYLSRYLTPMARLFETNDRVRKLVETGDTGFADAVEIEMGELREGGTPGVTKDADALALARVYAAAAETSRLDRNRFGGSIGRLDGWRPQSHDSALVAKVSREEWIDFIRSDLDPAKTFPGMNEAQQRRILSDMYDHIAMGMRLSREAGDPLARIGPANLANSMGAARELHFRDTEAWQKYRERFGQQHIHGAMMGHLERASRDAALLELLGPNPEAALATLRRQLAMDAAADPKLTYEQRQTARNVLTARRGVIDDAWAEASGLTSQPVGTRMADIFSTLRNQQRAAKLAGAVLSQVTDPAIRAARLTLQGAPLLQNYARSLGLFFGRNLPREVREQLASLGHGADAMRAAAIAEMTPEDSRPGVWSRIAATTFKIQGMNYLTARLRSGTAYMMSEWMGRNAGRDWSRLDPLYARRLENYGVTPAMWEAMRPLARKVGDATFLTPDLARDIPDAALAAMAKPELELLQKGLAETIARRAAANAQEAGWVTRRTARFEAELAKAQARMAVASARTKAAGAKEIGTLREAIDELRMALSELAEFKVAAAEGRLSPEVAPPAGQQFVPRMERYLHANTPPGEAALRGEGAIRQKLDRVRRAIGRVGQEAVRQDIRRLEDFEAQWNKKAKELEDFVARVDQRAKTRAAADMADRFDWEPRVRRVLDDIRRNVEMAFRRFYADEMLASTLEPDAQLRRFLYRGTQPGTAPGEALRAIALFKSFPVAYAQRVLAAAIHGYRPGERGRQAMHLASLIAVSTLLGYVGMTAKDAVRGYAPRDPTSHKTWLAAMAQGGGIGIYGDFLFGQGSRFGNSVLETIAGPALGGAANLIGMYQRAKEGDAKAGDALGVVLRETPFVNLWWARPALDIGILNSLREWASPGTLARQARKREQDYGQERWAPESVWR